ncbi:hypothetical protein STBA_04280 [Streptomyces sp. MP131-18]|nr:hypothetical protein STBA_04280 [Streptomyces sp. MP131-18]
MEPGVQPQNGPVDFGGTRRPGRGAEGGRR